MEIKKITTEDLCRMDGKEGMIIQGCGGDLQEWVDGMNKLLTEAGILKNGTRFEDVSAFQYGELTCLLYSFDNVDLDIGKLAIWRLRTHAAFGGTWLSDFVPNRLGGFISEPVQEAEKPDCALIGQDGNTFNLVGLPAVPCGSMGSRKKSKKCPTVFLRPAVIQRRLGSLASTSISHLRMNRKANPLSGTS